MQTRRHNWGRSVGQTFFFVCLSVIGLAGSASAQSVTLNWDPNFDANLAGYRVYRSEQISSFSSPPLNGGALLPSPSFLDNTLLRARNYYYVVTAVNTSGAESGYSNQIQVFLPALTTNAAPSVQAGPDRTITLPSSTSLSAIANDDGLPNPTLTYSWSLVSGGGVSFSNPNSANTQASFSAPGTRVLRVTVSDGQLSASDDVVVNVNAASPTNQAPTVNAGSDQSITLPSPASLVASANDDGLPSPTLTYSWSVVSGSGVTFSSPNSAATQATFSSAGTRVLRVTVNDGALSANDDLVVTVAAGSSSNQAPTVNAGPDRTVSLPGTASLSAIANDDGLPSPPALTFAWSVVSGSGVTFTNATSANTQASFAVAGTYVLRITVSDGQLSASDDVVVNVNTNAVNQPPLVNAGPNLTVVVTNPATLNAVATDDGLPSGSVLTYQWSVVSGSGVTIFSNPNAASTSVTFSTAGTATLRIVVTDGQLSASDDVTVTVNSSSNGNNQAPAVNAGPDQGISLPANASLSVAATDDGLPAGSPLTYQWSLLIGNSVTINSPNSQTTQVVFSGGGQYTFRATVSDGQFTTFDDVNVTVATAPANRPPTVTAGSDQTLIMPAGANLSAAATDDGLPAGGVLAYQWSVVSGAGVAFSNPNSATTQATFATPGTYTLRVTVSDGLLAPFDDIVVTVRPSSTTNQAPIVNAGVDQTVTASAGANLNPLVSDDGLPTESLLTYEWSILSGAGATLANPNSPKTSVTFSNVGTFVFRLTVTDGQLTSSDSVIVQVVNVLPSESTGSANLNLVVSQDGEALQSPLTPIVVRTADNRIQRIELLIDGQLQMVTSGQSLFYGWDTRFLTGNHTIQVIGYDPNDVVDSVTTVINIR